jgi:thioredoxin reductase (NADPH)
VVNAQSFYPEKPIYDIPGVPFQTAQEHVDALLNK